MSAPDTATTAPVVEIDGVSVRYGSGTDTVLALDLRRLDALVDLDPVSGIAVLQPGTTGPEAEAADRRWRERARRQRYVSYALAAAVGLIAFLMSSKPHLW